MQMASRIRLMVRDFVCEYFKLELMILSVPFPFPYIIPGPCLTSFHVECLGLETLPDDDEWFCSGCVANHHACYSFKKERFLPANNLNSAEQMVLQCQGQSCGKFYHESCLKQLPLTRMDTIRAASGRSNRLVCPVSHLFPLGRRPALIYSFFFSASHLPPLPGQLHR